MLLCFGRELPLPPDKKQAQEQSTIKVQPQIELSPAWCNPSRERLDALCAAPTFALTLPPLRCRRGRENNVFRWVDPRRCSHIRAALSHKKALAHTAD